MAKRSKRREKTKKRSSFLGGNLPLETETVWFLFVSALDVFMTYLIIRQPGFTEGNPIPKYFLNHWGIKGMVYFKFSMVAFIALITQLIALKREDIARRVLQFATLVVGGVVIYSLLLFLKSGRI